MHPNDWGSQVHPNDQGSRVHPNDLGSRVQPGRGKVSSGFASRFALRAAISKFD